MGSISTFLGKGLREPCSPYREAYVFGADLNTPNAGGWNCLAAIVGSTTNFDLSSISEGHEVVVALATVSNAREGSYKFNFKYYKDTPRTKLFEYTFSISTTVGSWAYAYAYIGWVSWEINQNGAYFVDVTITGPESYQRSIGFTVTGIPVEEPEPEPPPAYQWGIVDALNTVSSFFYSIYYDTFGWVTPLNFIAPAFYSLASLFSGLAWNFSSFFTWLNNIAAQIAGILDWSTIWSYILSYVPNLEDIRDWFYYWWDYVWGEIDTWWSVKVNEVLSWIEDAKLYAASLVANLNILLNSLQSAWDDFKGRIPTMDQVISWWGNWSGNILSVVNTWWSGTLLEVQGLINSAFVERESFWAGWQDWRDQVVEFFTDPEQWVYDRLDSFFERFW